MKGLFLREIIIIIIISMTEQLEYVMCHAVTWFSHLILPIILGHELDSIGLSLCTI